MQEVFSTGQMVCAEALPILCSPRSRARDELGDSGRATFPQDVFVLSCKVREPASSLVSKLISDSHGAKQFSASEEKTKNIVLRIKIVSHSTSVSRKQIEGKKSK